MLKRALRKLLIPEELQNLKPDQTYNATITTDSRGVVHSIDVGKSKRRMTASELKYALAKESCEVDN